MTLRTLLIFGLFAFPVASQAADYPYLDDSNQQPDGPTYTGNYPKVSLTETTSIGATEEAWSKYDLIGGKSGMSNKIAAVQAINPNVQYHYSFHPASYLGYIHNQPCEIAMGMPFNETGPATEDCAVYAGHWLYRAGTRLTSSINASQTTIYVADASRLEAGGYAVIYDSPAGSFNNPEHVEISSINTGVTPHRVVLKTRGFKSKASTHGQNSIIAQHELGRGRSVKNWAYNISTLSPRDSSNRTIAQVMANWIPANFRRNSRGQLTGIRVDGIYFDADAYHMFTAQADVNNDLIVDNGMMSNGENVWGTGLEDFYQRVRNALPNLRIVGGWRETRGFRDLNGVQMENWLVTNGDFDANPKYDGNGGAQSQMHNYLIHTQYHNRTEGYTEALSKNPTQLYPYTYHSLNSPANVSDNSKFRFGLGAVLLGNGHYARQNSDRHPDPWYDEYAVDVTPGSSSYGRAVASDSSDESDVRAHKGWLGRPIGPRKRIYDDADFARQNNLIANGNFEQGTGSWLFSNVSGSTDTNTKVEGTRSLKVSGHINFNNSLGGASVRGPQFNMVQGRRYTMTFSAKSSTMRSLFTRLDWSNNQGNFLTPTRWTRFVFTVTATTTGTVRPVFYLGRESTTVWIDDVQVFEGDPNIFRRDFENGIVVVNATPDDQTVDLEGTFERVLGTGQDPINNGATLTQVTLPAYDAAILVRPDGASSTPPPPPPSNGGGTCGAPSINLSGSPAMFAWADTCEPGKFHLTATSNGPLTNFVGSVESTSTISNVVERLIESGDQIEAPTSSSLSFALQVWNGEDALSFSTQSSADVCLDITSSAPLRIGETAVSRSGPVNLRTMEPCSCNGSQTEPVQATMDNPGLYAWKEACSDIFHVRATSNGPRGDYSGHIEGSTSLQGLVALENGDSVTQSSGGVDFVFSIWNGIDEFSFRGDAGPVCLILDSNSDGPVQYGTDASSVGRGVDLRTGQACQ